MKKNQPKQTLQYTLRGIPSRVDRNLKKRAHESGKSFNQVAVEALASGCGEDIEVYDDLDFLIGTLSDSEAKQLETELRNQRQVDAKLWK